jgi:hypothetical protein
MAEGVEAKLHLVAYVALLLDIDCVADWPLTKAWQRDSARRNATSRKFLCSKISCPSIEGLLSLISDSATIFLPFKPVLHRTHHYGILLN